MAACPYGFASVRPVNIVGCKAPAPPQDLGDLAKLSRDSALGRHPVGWLLQTEDSHCLLAVWPNVPAPEMIRSTNARQPERLASTLAVPNFRQLRPKPANSDRTPPGAVQASLQRPSFCQPHASRIPTGLARLPTMSLPPSVSSKTLGANEERGTGYARRSKPEHASAKLIRLSEILGCKRRCRFRHFAQRHRARSIQRRRRSRTIAGRDCSEISQSQEGCTHGPFRRSGEGGPCAVRVRRDAWFGVPARSCKRSLRRGIARGRRGDRKTATRP